MSATVRDNSRHIFPRWRSFRATASLGELSIPSVQIRRDTAQLDISLAKGIAEWDAEPSLWRSLDLLGSAIVAGKLDGFSELVKTVQANTATPPVALEMLEASVDGEEMSGPSELNAPSSLALQRDVRLHRARLSEAPRDAIEWIELARAYTISGINQKARRCISAALQLAPNNRFVLRSAARFLIHIGETERAHALLAKAPSTSSDSWLVASEIAIASSIGKTSRLVTAGRKMIGSDLRPSEVTELASAIGTLEAESGKDRLARKFLRQAVIGANENSIAQISWLNRSYLGEAVDISRVTPPLLHESNAWTSFYAADFNVAREESMSWLTDQPFASAPAVLSSFILSDVFGDYVTARDIARASLVANPDDETLMNNLAVCLLELDEVEEAASLLDRISTDSGSKIGDAVHKATSGKLAFRRGRVEQGRSLYLEAISDALESNNKVIAARAAITLAMEELHAGTDEVEKAIVRLREYKELESDNEIAYLLDRFKTLLQ